MPRSQVSSSILWACRAPATASASREVAAAHAAKMVHDVLPRRPPLDYRRDGTADWLIACVTPELRFLMLGGDLAVA